MDASTPIRVVLSDEQTVKVNHARIVEVAIRTARSEGATGEISITLADRIAMAELNRIYMGEPGPTDVLSFPIDGPQPLAPDGPPRMIGEVVLCPQVAWEQAPSDPESELDLLTAHAVLHLLGYEHDTEDNARQMRLREQELTGRAGARAG